MHDQKQGAPAASEQPPAIDAGETRLQQAGEGGTTRFGMEEGDNTDIPATGGPASDDEQGKGSSRRSTSASGGA